MRFKKYFYISSIVILILFLLVQYNIYNNVKEQAIQNVNANQLIHAQQAASGIQDYMDGMVKTLKFLSNFPEIINMNEAGRRILANYQSIDSDEIKGITRINSKGIIIYTFPNTESIGKNVSAQGHVILSMKTHKVVISDVFMAVQGFRTIAVNVPVFKNEIYDGTITFLLSFDKIAQKYIEKIQVGKSGYSWVVSEKGFEISSPFPDHIGKNIYEIYKGYPEIITMTNKMLKGKEGAATYNYNRILNGTEEDVPFHAVYMPIKLENTFWSIVIATPENEVIASLSGLRSKLLLITISLLGIYAIFMYLILRSQINIGERRNRQAILESESRYKKLFEQNPMPMLIYELSSLRMLAVNDAFTIHYGYSKQEALELHLTDIYIENEKKAIAELTSKLHGHEYVGEWHHLKKDGTPITIEAHSHGLTYEGRDARIAVLTDITNRKKSEEIIEASERRLSLIFDSVGDVIFLLSVEPEESYRFISINPLFLTTTGLNREQVIGKRIEEVLPKTAHNFVKEKYKQAIKENKMVKWEEVSDYPTGKLYGSVSITPALNAEGDCTHLIGTVHDITEIRRAQEEISKLNSELEQRVTERTEELEIANEELKKEIETRKQTERELTASEQRLENILNYAPILVYINDLEGRYIFVNKEFEKSMRLPYDEVIKKRDMDLFPKERAERNIAQNKKVITTRSSQIFENASQKKDGIHYFVDILFPIFDSKNEIYATCGWSLDITDRKKSEQVLKEAKERAESADQLKSAFLATMSHELRTPLNSIIGFTGILMKGIAGPLNAEQLKQLGMAKGSAQHLLELINDVLDISKIEAGELVVSLRQFNFSKSLEKVISNLRPLAEKKNLELRTEISAEVIKINSDERRVEQILLNLINNAIKFTDSGHVNIKCGIFDHQIITEVKDTGIGIKNEDVNKLFKPFSQIDTGLTRTHEGTGLGLSISKKLLEKLGGTISVESEFGKGSIFTIKLPLNVS